MLHNFPFTALLFEINPELLDVNVHPAKREFRLTTSEKVCASVRDALRAAIEKSNIIPEVTPDQKDVSEEKEDRSSQGAHFLHERSFNSSVMADGLFGGGNSEAITSDEIEAAMEKEEAEVAERIASPDAAADEILMRISGKMHEEKKADHPKENFIQQEIKGVKSGSKYRLLGQLFATYWLIEAEDTFYMMDQHAAHEKVLYERLMKTIEAKAPQTQMLTVPEVVDITPETKALLSEDGVLFESFKALGYELENFGEKSVKVTGIPAGLPTMDYKQMLKDIMDGLADKKAIKGNDRISGSEALELLDEMMKAENPYNCPHGRPTLIAMSKNEIEKKFKRIV